MVGSSSNAGVFGATFVLGVALSGFFDGILLHQILQWHHLLSLVDAEAVRSVRAQILADGLFHVLMYIVAVLGLVLLWRARAATTVAGAGRRICTGLLAGFGVWNVVDVVLFHWVMNIHHIRLDVPNPVAWDVGWLVVFGGGPLLAAILVGRKHASPPTGPGAPRTAVMVLALVVALAGAWNLAPPPSRSQTLVVFRPGADIMAAVVAADALLVQSDEAQSMAVLQLPPGARPWLLYRHGAMLVQGAGPSGCLAWSRA